MTNAEKYLKDGADIEELIKEIDYYVDKKYKEEYEWFHTVPLFRYLEDFFNIDLNKPIKPTLTEEERVILKNVGTDYQSIDRDDECLWVRGVDKDGFRATCYFKCFDHLFQFIKERRRI